MTTLLERLLSKITSTNIHEEIDWGCDVGKENPTVFDRLLPNLLPCEIERGDRIEQDVEWEKGACCKECGDKMWWFERGDKKKILLCRSWIYMEGGCYTEGDW